MSADEGLAALGLIQVAARMQATPGQHADRREEIAALLDGCDVEQVALLLAGMVLTVAEASRFPLSAMLAAERRDLLDTGDDPPSVG